MRRHHTLRAQAPRASRDGSYDRGKSVIVGRSHPTHRSDYRMAIGSTDQNPFFPWRNGNRYQLLIDGEKFYPAMLEAIAGARTHILLEMYLMESGSVAERFITALCAAAARGVAVHVLLDDFGVRGLQRHDRDRLAAAGVTPAYFNPLRRGRLRANLSRNHGKFHRTGGARLADAVSAYLAPPHRPQLDAITAHRPADRRSAARSGLLQPRAHSPGDHSSRHSRDPPRQAAGVVHDSLLRADHQTAARLASGGGARDRRAPGAAWATHRSSRGSPRRPTFLSSSATPWRPDL